MVSIAPVLVLEGTVRTVRERRVEDFPGADEVRDEEGRVTRPARPPAAGYTVFDVAILTEHGGFAACIIHEDALAALGGVLPTVGDKVAYPVRPYVKTERTNRGAWIRSVGFSVAADVAAASKSYQPTA